MVALDPIRARLLAELGQPASAAALAARIGLRQWGGLTERLLVASAASHVISPAALGPIAAAPERTSDRLSVSYLIALAARAVSEVGELWRRALQSKQRLATLSIDTELSFASPAARAAFRRELTQAITELAARYHEPGAPGARSHRLLVLAHPAPVLSSNRKD